MSLPSYKTSEWMSMCVVWVLTTPPISLSCSRTAVHENFRAKIRALCVMFCDGSLTVLVSALGRRVCSVNPLLLGDTLFIA